eukprot:TRINITY_DN29466_c0_g1_i1.p1 TRINITY_DN29466_c0_g1~~TRINITY_DN29466_c0_g1_i1.p1  ORF type:complete len:434 (+),score=90.90 TRINITY_DN29466_c0_g1_i1:94-1302(+)
MADTSRGTILAAFLLGSVSGMLLTSFSRTGQGPTQQPDAQTKAVPDPPAAEWPPPPAVAWQLGAAPGRWAKLLPASKRDWLNSTSPDLSHDLYSGEHAFHRGMLFEGWNITQRLQMLGCDPPYTHDNWVAHGKPRIGPHSEYESGCYRVYTERTDLRKHRRQKLLSIPEIKDAVHSARGIKKVMIDLGGNKVMTFHGTLREYPEVRSLCLDAVVFEPAPIFIDQWKDAVKRQQGRPREELCKMGSRELNQAPEGSTHPRMRKWTGMPTEFFPAAVWTKNGTMELLDARSANAARLRDAGKVQLTAGNSGPAHRATAQLVDLAEFLQARYRPEDFVVIKMDIEGAEHDVVPHLISTGAVRLIDEVLIECHCVETWGVTPWRFAECYHLMMRLMEEGVYVHEWF